MSKKRNRVSNLRNGHETVREHALLYRKARNGEMPLTDFCRYSVALSNHRNMLESTQTEDRLGKIEERLEQIALSDTRNVVQFKKPA